MSQIIENSSRRRLQVDSGSGKVPKSVRSLMDLEYLERSVYRMLCGWGNQFADWDDKIALSKHVWDQAEIVQRLRNRIDQFPGVHAGEAVSDRLEELANTVLLAPSFEDAVDGIYQLFSTGLVNAYLDFLQRVHPIHDAPTHQILREIVTLKDLQRKWRSEYRRRRPHQTDAAYAQRVEQALASVGRLQEPLSVENDHQAHAVGERTQFRPLTPNIPYQWLSQRATTLNGYISADFSTSVETRRLFWPIGYMRELGLGIDQLLWLYDALYMPWEWHHDIARHMWDESRHGDSGYCRMKDFGLTIEEVGFSWGWADELGDKYPTPPKPTKPMTAAELYEQVFFIGVVAETGYFKVKREAYADFRDGGDLESAEMMLYDIIDETTHVQYAHKWLDEIARHAGIDNGDVEARGAQRRSEAQAMENLIIQEARALPRTEETPAYAQYQQLLERLRTIAPLGNAATCPPRSAKPM